MDIMLWYINVKIRTAWTDPFFTIQLDSLVLIVTRRKCGFASVQMPLFSRYFSRLQHGQLGSRSYPSFLDIKRVPLGLSGSAIHYLHPLVPSLGMSGTTPLLPLHAFVTMTGKFYLVFYCNKYVNN